MLSIDDFEVLLEQAEVLERGSASQIELLQQAVSVADLQNNTYGGYETRDALIEAAEYGGRSELLFPAFAWILGQMDRGNLPKYVNRSVLWKYKWAINRMCGFPSISAVQIEAATQDFATRLEQIGENPRVLHFLRWKYQYYRGDTTQAIKEMNLWQKFPRSHLADCPACEAHFHAEFLIWLDQPEEALRVAQPILAGRLQCSEIPQITYAAMIRPLLKLQRFDEAKAMYSKGYRLIKKNFELVHFIGYHLEFLVFSKNLSSAIRLFEKHLPWALVQNDLSIRFDFYLSLLPLWKSLLDKSQMFIKLQLPNGIPLEPQSKGYVVDELQKYFISELEKIAALFDARNGTTAFADRIYRSEPWLEAVPHIPLRQTNSKNEVL